MYRYKKIFCDVVLNIFATAIPLIALQLIILPCLATRVPETEYGLILTLISLLTVVGNSFGNALNNVRLISNNKYIEHACQGDFPIFLLTELFIGVFLVLIWSKEYSLSVKDFILLAFLIALWIAREYYIVAFRINLNFKGIVINNLVMVFGYAIGFFLYLFVGYWEVIYIIGIGLSIIYIQRNSSIGKEKLVVTSLFRITLKNIAFLTCAAFIGNLLNYADRIIIYPLLGGTMVSIYYASSLFGKMISTVISPLNSVMLSYLSRKDRIKKNMFLHVVLISFLVALLGYALCRIFAYPMLSLLYPQWAEAAIVFIPITTLTAMLAMISGVLTPFILRFCDMRWQVVINSATLIIYVILSIRLFNIYELKGFCIGVLVSNLIKVIILVLLGMKMYKEQDIVRG